MRWDEVMKECFLLETQPQRSNKYCKKLAGLLLRYGSWENKKENTYLHHHV